MNKIRVSTDEMVSIIADKKFDYDQAVEIWLYILKYGFVFNEYTLVWENEYIYKVKLVETENEGHQVHIKRIYEMKDHTHKTERFDFSIEQYIQNLTDGILQLKGKNFLEMIKYAKNTKSVIRETWALDVLPAMAFMQYVVYEAMNREVVEMGTTQKRYKPMAERTYKPNSNKVYKLIDVVRKYEKHINHAKRHVTCDYWEVKGHFRHYKSGKTVYIKPYAKGKGKEERLVTEREYRL